MLNQKGNILVPLLATVALISLVAAGYFFWQNQQLQNQPIVQYSNPISTPTPAPTIQSETANWKTFNNSEFNFTFKYPPSWTMISTIPQDYRNKMLGNNCVGKTIFQNTTTPSTLLVIDPQLEAPHVGFCWAEGIFSETGKRISAISPTKAVFVTKWRSFKEGGEEEWK